MYPKYEYVGSTLELPAQDIKNIFINAEEISLSNFRKYCSCKKMAEIETSHGYGRGIPIKKDWRIKCFKSKLEGKQYRFISILGNEYYFTSKSTNKVRKFGHNWRYERFGTLLLKDLYLLMPIDYTTKTLVKFYGKQVSVAGKRLACFKKMGAKCVSCGVEGSYAAIEKKASGNASNTFHINIWAIDANDNHILMTIDHIVPLSKGGSNNFENLQIMCEFCNGDKGDKHEFK